MDFYGTLAGWQPARAEIQQRAASAEGLRVDAEAVEHAYPTADAFMDRENAVRRIASRTQTEQDEFFARYEHTLLAAVGSEVPLEVASRIWERVRTEPKQFGLYPDALPALTQLSEAGLLLGVISNMGSDLHRIVQELGMGSCVKVAVSSGEVGITKPHPAIFRAGLIQAGVEPSEALHVGDGYDSDIIGARNAGMHSLLLLRDANATPPPDCDTVGSLTEVLGHAEARYGIA